MSHVTGYVDGIAYTAVINDPNPAADKPAVGVVTGSPNVLTLLHAYDGEDVGEPMPTMGPVTLDVNDPASVVAALHALTQVVEVSDDLAAPYKDVPGVVH